jgi:hypothetical protein
MTVSFFFGGLAFLVEIIEHGKVFQLFLKPVIHIGPAFEQGYFLQLLFSLFGIIPEILGLGLYFLFFDQGKLAVNVKDTSPGRWCALLTL